MGRDCVLRVATFNLRNGLAWDRWNSWPFRRRATLQVLRDLDADVIGVQEAYWFQLRWLVRRLHEYEVFGQGRDGGDRGERVALLVRRRDWAVVEHRTRWFGAEPDLPGTRLEGARFPRTTTTAVFEHASGARVHITNTHLDEGSAQRRRRSVQQLLEWLDRATPHVLLGDLNATPDDAMFIDLAEAGFRQALPAEAGGTFHRFTGRHDGRRIDHILVTATVDVLDAQVVHAGPESRPASDHWPVLATLRV